MECLVTKADVLALDATVSNHVPDVSSPLLFLADRLTPRLLDGLVAC